VGQARSAARAGLREHALFHDQLRARGVPDAAVPLVDAAPVPTQQAARDFGRLGCFQAGDWLELRAQRPVGDVFQQGGGVRATCENCVGFLPSRISRLRRKAETTLIVP
jgi:hypothetical protein